MKFTIGKFHFSDTYTFLPNNIFTLQSFYSQVPKQLDSY